MTRFKYFHGDEFYDTAELLNYRPPTPYDVEMSHGPVATPNRHTETHVAPPRLTLRLTRTPEQRQDIALENRSGRREHVRVEHIGSDNTVTLTGAFSDDFVHGR